MKILYLHQYFNTPAMSGGTRSWEMGRRFVAAGHEVHVITSDREPPARSRGWRGTDEAGMRVHWLPVEYANQMSYRRRLGAFGQFAWGAARRAVAVGGDVVLATSTPLTIALPGAWASSRLRVPMVFEVRDLWPEVPIAMGLLRAPGAVWAARRLARFAYGHSARVIALSSGMEEGIVATGYPSERVEVIPNGCDLELFDVGAECGRAFRAKHGWLGKRPLVLYAGAIGMVNGVGWLVRVATHAVRLDPDICFLVLGTGREEDLVREEAMAAGVLERNFFMLPPLPKAKMPAVFSASTVVISLCLDLPVLNTNSANKVFDSLAAGRPIGVNHGGWLAAMIERTGCGLVLSPDDPMAAAHELIEAVRDQEWLERAGRAAGRLAAGVFARDLLAARMLRSLEAAVEA